MKTSRILIAAFVLISIVTTAIMSLRTVRMLDSLKDQDKISKGDFSKADKISIASSDSLYIQGGDKLYIVANFDSTKPALVALEKGWKDSIEVKQENGAIKLLSKVKNVKGRVLVVLNMAAPKAIYVDGANAEFAGFSGDNVNLSVSGNTELRILNGKVGTLNLTGTGNADVDFEEGAKVDSYAIKISQNVNVSGVSANSKLSMSVDGNAKVSLRSGK